jgi:hypothetical protein
VFIASHADIGTAGVTGVMFRQPKYSVRRTARSFAGRRAAVALSSVLAKIVPPLMTGCADTSGSVRNNQSGGSMTKILLRSVAVAAMLLGSGQAVQAENTVPFPDVNGKMVQIPIAHTYEQCRKNGRHLGYPDADSHAWCTQHCDGKICQ